MTEAMTTETYLEDMDEEVPEAAAIEEFVVDDDQKAEWCLHKIREAQAETERWKRFYAERAKAVEESNMFRIARLKQKLLPYLMSVPRKDTKTQQKYSLLSGDLILKKEHTRIDHDDEALLPWVKQNAYEYVRVKESVDWRSLKDHLIENGGEYFLAETGEKVPGVTDTIVAAEFEVRLKDLPGSAAE
jgi:hypothetical protein